MAGDWIKMRIDLTTHPKVVRILSAICPQNVREISANGPHNVRERSDRLRVVGGLHAVWGIFDTHSEDGILLGYSLDALDNAIGWAGFSAAMTTVGWLSVRDDGGLEMPEFEAHNGQSGKRRAEDQKRKRVSRSASAKRPQSVRKTSA